MTIAFGGQQSTVTVLVSNQGLGTSPANDTEVARCLCIMGEHEPPRRVGPVLVKG
jgi:hypothetical protein